MMKQNEKAVYQIIDANLNRAREGVRVVEEVFRFINKKSQLHEELKDFRHKVFKAGQKFPVDLVKIKLSRNVNGDAGKDSFTDSEKLKSQINDLVFANWQRVEESLRVLEEYAKLVEPKAGFRFKKLRFQAYSLEQEIIKSL